MAIEQFSTMLAQSSGDGGSEPQPGLHVYRHSTRGERIYNLSKPAFCVIAQGSKHIMLGEQVFRCDPAHYLITTMELPLIGEVVDASPARPYLSVKVTLDPALVTSVMMESGLVPANGDGDTLAIDASPLDADLLDATLRLVRLIERPAEYRVLAPLVTREIIYRLLAGAQGHRLRHLVTVDGRAHRIARAVDAIREHFDKPLRIEAIARQLGLSVSAFHAHFKAVIGMSPLQFQKQLRLQEARRLLMSEDVDAAEAGYRVGYEDPSHFSREYKRHFGQPPIRDVERLRELVF